MGDERPKKSPATESSALGIPRTSEERARLVRDRPPGWEHLLFGGVLLEGKKALELNWRDHQLRLPTASYRRLDDDEVAGCLSEAFGHLAWIIEPTERVFEAQEDAFGKSGEPGSHELIEHLGKFIVSVYARLMEWAGTLRSVGVSEEFENAVALSARAADLPIQQIRGFLDSAVREIEQIPAHMAKSESERDRLTVNLTLTISADNDLMEEAVDELKAALGQ